MSDKKKKVEKISGRLDELVGRLRDLESSPAPDHYHSIIEVGISALKAKIRDLGRQLRDLA